MNNFDSEDTITEKKISNTIFLCKHEKMDCDNTPVLHCFKWMLK